MHGMQLKSGDVKLSADRILQTLISALALPKLAASSGLVTSRLYSQTYEWPTCCILYTHSIIKGTASRRVSSDNTKQFPIIYPQG